MQEDDDDDDDPSKIPVKSWNFPKLHLRQHLFDDIINKGVARNFSTKPNESMHGPIQKSYLRRTNFKNFADQVGCDRHFSYFENFTNTLC